MKPIMNTPFTPDLAAHALAIERMAHALCASDAEADDVGQEIALAALQGRAPVPQRVAHSFGAWLAGVARNVARNRQRQERRIALREQSSARAEALPSAAERCARLELETRLVSFVRELPANQCEVLYLRFWEELPPREIARRLGVGVETVKTRQKRALAALRERLERETPGGRAQWMGALGLGTRIASSSLPVQSAATAAWPTLTTSVSLGLVMFKKLALAGAAVLAAAGMWWRFSSAPRPPANVPGDAGPTSSAMHAPSLVDGDGKASPDLAQVLRTAAPQSAKPPLPPGTFVVQGRVVNVPVGGSGEQATPAIDVLVQFGPRFLGLGDEPDPTRQVRTDQDGRFRFEWTHAKDKAMALGVTTEQDDRFADSYCLVKLDPKAAPYHEILLERFAHGDLHGETVDLEGRAIAGVAVEVNDSAESVSYARSDQAGQFVFSNLTHAGELYAALAGWAQVVRPIAEREERGGWKRASLTLVPSATLQVKIEDERANPIEGVELRLSISAAERFGSDRDSLGLGGPAWLEATTNAEGIAVIADAWAGVKLSLKVPGNGTQHVFEREVEGLAVLGDAQENPQSRALVLAPRTERLLTIRWSPRSVLRGQVMGPTGAPFPQASVLLRSMEKDHRQRGYVSIVADSDDEGRFTIQLHPPHERCQLLLTATDMSPYTSRWPAGTAPLAASKRLDSGDLPTEEVKLVLAPTNSITGSVIDADGRPIEAMLRIAPSGEPLTGFYLETGFLGRAEARSDGDFTFAGLPDSIFDVSAHSRGYAQAKAERIPAGTTGLVLRMDRAPPARVTISVEAPGMELTSLIVLRGQLYPHPGRHVDTPLLPEEARYTQPRGWPENALGLTYGTEGDTSALGDERFEYWPIEGTSTSMELDPGWYWFGAKGQATDGTTHGFPMGTGLVRLEAGTHRLHFVLSASARIQGRLIGMNPLQDLRVGLCTSDGEFIPLDVRRETLCTTFEFGADGSFVLDKVPVGEFELRVGTQAELESGTWRARKSVSIESGAQLEVTLEQ